MKNSFDYSEGGFDDHPSFIGNGRGIYADTDGSRGLSLDNSSLTRSLGKIYLFDFVFQPALPSKLNIFGFSYFLKTFENKLEKN